MYLGTRPALRFGSAHQNCEDALTRLTKLVLVGLGKIAYEQHIPAIERSSAFTLVGGVDPHAISKHCFPIFDSVEHLLDSGIEFEAVALCTPPQVRKGISEQLLSSGRAVLLEKPPASDLASARAIEAMAKGSSAVLFAAWHSRFSAHVADARQWVLENRIASGSIEWRENPEKWHPGQDWLWRAGGYGVFDPGINALSILTEISRENWRVSESSLRIPPNAQAPDAADFRLSAGDANISVSFEFHQRKDEVWRIQLVSKTGNVMELSDGGAALLMDGSKPSQQAVNEYDGVYQRFAELIRSRRSEFDLAPLRIAEEAMSLGFSNRLAP